MLSWKTQIFVCSGSRSALEALRSVDSNSALVKDCINLLSEVASVVSLILVCIPGRSGIPVNETADAFGPVRIHVPYSLVQ